jgi:hypothetical protein
MDSSEENINYSALVDKLGAVREELTRLEAQDKELRAQLLKSNQTLIVGTIYSAVLTTQERSNRDWHEIIKKANVAASVVDECTTKSSVITVTCRKNAL